MRLKSHADAVISKSSGEQTNPSSPHLGAGKSPEMPPNIQTKLEPSAYKGGVASPDRYVTHCGAPPPLSQRHLLEALASADINAKDGEVGDRDEIRAASPNQRLNGAGHLIPPGRSQMPTPSPSDPRDKTRAATHTSHHTSSAQHTHGANHPHVTHDRRSHRRRQDSSRAKAFAFFGQVSAAPTPNCLIRASLMQHFRMTRHLI